MLKKQATNIYKQVSTAADSATSIIQVSNTQHMW